MAKIHPQSIHIPLDHSEATHPLAHIHFNTTTLAFANTLTIGSGIEQINEPSSCETFLTTEKLSTGQTDNLFWSTNDDYLFLAKTSTLDTISSFHDYIKTTYIELLNFMQEKGFNQIAKIWNYIPQINQGLGDNETYKVFTQARYQAFNQIGVSSIDFPAASALGSSGNEMIIYLLASKKKTQHFENPQQTKAYNYPRKFGPKSPSFARATLLEGSPNSTLFVSGTASIIGSESMYIDSVEQQAIQASKNVVTLLQHIARKIKINAEIAPKTIKVYVRNVDDYTVVKNSLENFWQDRSIAFIYTLADICRQELSVEIEAICELPNYPKT